MAPEENTKAPGKDPRTLAADLTLLYGRIAQLEFELSQGSQPDSRPLTERDAITPPPGMSFLTYIRSLQTANRLQALRIANETFNPIADITSTGQVPFNADKAYISLLEKHMTDYQSEVRLLRTEVAALQAERDMALAARDRADAGNAAAQIRSRQAEYRELAAQNVLLQYMRRTNVHAHKQHEDILGLYYQMRQHQLLTALLMRKVSKLQGEEVEPLILQKVQQHKMDRQTRDQFRRNGARDEDDMLTVALP
ncbi:hypothetical protein CAC42_3050 [Sphaceloma murrayae]|uniref:Uncharacterized protein n=1 Tax=Sphaceloma murrayae TaxID=2082308 RepID=A0A2K1QRG8_9PEZI|nr:hypothetical protein CAC42_3050 [Sphaceloma murrayae]